MKLNNNQLAFIALLKAGLWEKECRLLIFGEVSIHEILRLSISQGVIGIITAGVEHVSDTRLTKKDVIPFMGNVIQVEQRNKAMDVFISDLTVKMQSAGIRSVLVKGQGVAQCYKRPHWRSSGDIDFLLSGEDYQKAIDLLLPLSSGNKPEGMYSKHLGLSMGEWYVELHGTLRSGLSTRIDRAIDTVQEDTFRNGHVRVWKDGETEVLLPSPDNDVFFIFTHFIKHFYKEGLGLKQVCDWCRLLWIYHDKLDKQLLKARLRESGLMSEWKGFSSVVVDFLGMPLEAMPFYDSRFKNKGTRIINHILSGYSGNKIVDAWQIAKLYPWKTLIYLPSILFNVNVLKIRERLFAR